jgi:nucleotide-binding universal stress UspA family protein
MAMKTILMLAHDDAGQEARLQAALDVSRRFEAHLTCLDVAVVPEVVGTFYGGLGKAIMVQEEFAQEAQHRTRIEARLATEELAWSYETSTDRPGRAIAEAAVFADLIVLNRDLDFLLMPDMGATVGDALARTRVPILAVGSDDGGIDLESRTIIAWDGSPTAVTAVRAAVPLLRQSVDVMIYAVDDGSIERPAEEAAVYLSRHGVRTTILCDKAAGRRPAELVLEQVERTGAAYVVMGGYGHSPMIERLIGGMTRKMMSTSPVPLLLAH